MLINTYSDDVLKNLDEIRQRFLEERTTQVPNIVKQPRKLFGIEIPFLKKDVQHGEKTVFKTQADLDGYKAIKKAISDYKNSSPEERKTYKDFTDYHKSYLDFQSKEVQQNKEQKQQKIKIPQDLIEFKILTDPIFKQTYERLMNNPIERKTIDERLQTNERNYEIQIKQMSGAEKNTLEWQHLHKSALFNIINERIPKQYRESQEKTEKSFIFMTGDMNRLTQTYKNKPELLQNKLKNEISKYTKQTYANSFQQNFKTAEQKIAQQSQKLNQNQGMKI
jgi:hypothetical protein